MIRLTKLLSLSEKIKKSKYCLILVQIQEAHTKLWPLGMTNHPDLQKTFSDRVERANIFKDKYKIPYKIVIDPWGDIFENIYHAWPDKYYLIGTDHRVITKSEYNMGAIVVNDYADFLESELLDLD